jgi:hypothetical protein
MITLVFQGLTLSHGNGILIFVHDPKSSLYGLLLCEYENDLAFVNWSMYVELISLYMFAIQMLDFQSLISCA